MQQKVLFASDNYIELDKFFSEKAVKSLFLVCDAAFGFLKISKYLNEIETRLGIKVVKFDDFQPNPLYESVVKGVELFHSEKCEMIMAVGGGSAIDVAKCIKLYSNMDSSVNYLKQDIVANDIEFVAVPTTAGTGSEATRYAVIYYEGEKQSVSDYSCIPGTVLMDVSVLETLPAYQKKSTMFDALCHAIESYWSVNSNKESMEYSRKAIELVKENKDLYLANDKDGNANMLKAANFAGKAINITQTTAGHAMCYKLTSLYGIAHGHAAALCVSKLWPYMKANTNKCIDGRGEVHLTKVFEEIEKILTVEEFDQMILDFELSVPNVSDENDYVVLKNSVNPVRLKNNPVGLTTEVIDDLYHKILGKN